MVFLFDYFTFFSYVSVIMTLEHNKVMGQTAITNYLRFLEAAIVVTSSVFDIRVQSLGCQHANLG